MSDYKNGNGHSKIHDRYTRLTWSWGYSKDSELYIILNGHKKTTMAISNFMTILVHTFGHYMYCNNFIGNLFKFCLDHVHENDHGGLIRYDF